MRRKWIYPALVLGAVVSLFWLSTVTPRAAASSSPSSSSTTTTTQPKGGTAPRIVGCRNMVHRQTSHFRIWVCRDKNSDATTQMEKLGSIAESYYGPMTHLMGKPLPDSGGIAGGGNTDVDLYLVDGTAQEVARDGSADNIGTGNIAAALPTNPHGTTASGYMLLDRTRLGAKGFASDFVHEFFHILQFRTNTADCGWWYVEASAVWAEAYFDPGEAPGEVYNKWYDLFEKHPGYSLLHPANSDMPYADFIWPFFQAQEKGAKSVASTWAAIKGITSCRSMDDALNRVFPFADHFRDFAVRNLDSKFDRWSGRSETPIDFGKTYQEAKAANGSSEGFPDTEWPDFAEDISLTKSGSSPLKLKLPPESTEYVEVNSSYDFDVSDPVGSFQLDTSGLTGAKGLSLDTLGYEPGNAKHVHWIRIRDAKPTDGVCTMWDDDASEDELYLVLTNSSLTKTVEGTAKLNTMPICAKSATGTATHTESVVDPSGDTLNATVTMQLHLAQGPNAGELDSTVSPYSYSFSGTMVNPACSFSGSGSSDMTTDGADGSASLYGYETDRTNGTALSEVAAPPTPATGCAEDGPIYLRDNAEYCPITDNPVAEPVGNATSYDGSYSADFTTVTLNCHDSGTDWFGDSVTESMTGTINVAGVVPCGLFTTDCKDGEVEKS